MNIHTDRDRQKERTEHTKHIMSTVLEANPNKGYNNPTTIAGCIFSTLITDYMHGRDTIIKDLATLHENMSTTGSLEGTKLHSLKRVMLYLATIADALEAVDQPPIELEVRHSIEGFTATFR